VGVSAGTAGAAITIPGHITFYPVASGYSPSAIVGSSGGDVWFIQKDSSETCFGPCDYASRITVGGTFDGDANISYGANSLNNLAVDSAGDAFATDAAGYAIEISSSLGVSYWTGGPPLNNGQETQVYGAVGVSGTTPYWGSAADEATDELFTGFPVVADAAATLAPVTSMATGPSGEIDMIQGTRDYGFYSSGTLTSCIGSAEQFFPSNSDIVNLASGSAGLWFADAGRGSIWQYDGSCQGTEYPIPGGAAPKDITEGADGNVYFTTQGAVWEFIPSTGVFYDYTAPGLNDPEGITLGSDGNIWFSDTNGHQIGKLVPYVASNPYGVLHRWTLPSGSGNNPCLPCHWMGVNLGQLPSGYGNETTLGYVYQNPGPGLDALYACSDGGQGDYLSLDPTGGCADSDVPPSGPPPTNLGVQGYVYSSAPTDGTDALQLYQCNDDGTDDWLATTTPPGGSPGNTQPCGEDPSAYTLDDALGYVVNAGPPPVLPEISAVPLLAGAGAAVMAVAWIRNRRRRVAVPRRG
jgi:streptogramin lyase